MSGRQARDTFLNINEYQCSVGIKFRNGRDFPSDDIR